MIREAERVFRHEIGIFLKRRLFIWVIATTARHYRFVGESPRMASGWRGSALTGFISAICFYWWYTGLPLILMYFCLSILCQGDALRRRLILPQILIYVQRRAALIVIASWAGDTAVISRSFRHAAPHVAALFTIRLMMPKLSGAWRSRSILLLRFWGRRYWRLIDDVARAAAAHGFYFIRVPPAHFAFIDGIGCRFSMMADADSDGAAT